MGQPYRQGRSDWYPPGGALLPGSQESYAALCSGATAAAWPTPQGPAPLLASLGLAASQQGQGASSGQLLSSGTLAMGFSSGSLLSSGGLRGQSSGCLQPMSSGLLRPDQVPGEQSPSPLTVAHVGPCLVRGGAEQQLIDLARFLDPRQAVLRECLVTPGAARDPVVANEVGCRVTTADAAAIARVYEQYDVVLSWGLPLDECAPVPARRRAVGIHIAHGDSSWTRSLLQRSRGWVDHAVAVSQRVKTTTCDGVPTTVILNGVDTSRLATTRSRDDVRAEFGYRPDDFVVGFVGRFSPEKRPELLLRAVEQLPPRFKALIVGWGPMFPALLAEANARIPNRCVFRYADRNLGDYYQAFDAFALLSVQEGFALVFLEAMFLGLPVVATPVGAVPEVIRHRVNGIIVDGTVEAVVAELRELEAHRQWGQGVGQSARQYAMQHGHARRMAREYEALFSRLVAERSAAACCA